MKKSIHYIYNISPCLCLFADKRLKYGGPCRSVPVEGNAAAAAGEVGGVCSVIVTWGWLGSFLGLSMVDYSTSIDCETRKKFSEIVDSGKQKISLRNF